MTFPDFPEFLEFPDLTVHDIHVYVPYTHRVLHLVLINSIVGGGWKKIQYLVRVPVLL